MAKQNNNHILIISTIIGVALLNYVTGVISNFLSIPFFLDTWATSLGVLVGGLWIGMVGGVLYNLVMAATVWGIDSWVWAFANIWIAIATFYFWKKDYINIQKPGKVLQAGIIIGLTSAIVTFLIAMIFFDGLPTYEGTKASFDAFLAATGSVPAASFLQHLITELGDKTASVFIAAIVFSSVPKKWIFSKK